MSEPNNEYHMSLRYGDGRLFLEVEELLRCLSDATKRVLFRTAVDEAFPEMLKKLVDRFSAHWSDQGTKDDDGEPDGNWWGTGDSTQALRLVLMPVMPEVARAAVSHALAARQRAEVQLRAAQEHYRHLERVGVALLTSDSLSCQDRCQKTCRLLEEHVPYRASTWPTEAEIDEAMAQID